MDRIKITVVIKYAIVYIYHKSVDDCYTTKLSYIL